MAICYLTHFLQADWPDFFASFFQGLVWFDLRMRYLTHNIICQFGDISVTGHMRTVLDLFLVFEADRDVVAFRIWTVLPVD